MIGINMNRPMEYRHSSLRYFAEGERHIARRCPDDVLLLVYDGVLRFSENGTAYEVGPGEYHIQSHDSLQKGPLRSDAPKYLYVHFFADWVEDGAALPKSGTFSYATLRPLMETLDRMAHSGTPYIEQAAVFFELLTSLYHTRPSDSVADRICDYIEREYRQPLSLDLLCSRFHFSKNHLIHLMKEATGMTPIAYIHTIRLQKAEHLLEKTADSLEMVAAACGFPSYSHFYRLFLRKNHLSPEKWRKQKRIGHMI